MTIYDGERLCFPSLYSNGNVLMQVEDLKDEM